MRDTYDVRESYTGTGLLDTYSFDFKIEALTQLLVVEYDADGVETQRVRGDDVTYLDSVTFDAVDGGGEVVLADPLTDDYTLILLLANDSPTQGYEFKNKSDFTLSRIERALDFVAGAVQRLAYLANLSVKLPDKLTTALFDPTLPGDIVSAGAGCVLAINDAADGFELGPTTDSIFAASAAAVAAEGAAEAAQAAAEAAEASALIAETNAELAQAGAETAEANAEAALAALLAGYRSGSSAISNGVSTHSVVFSSAMANTNYAVNVNIGNAVDADPIQLSTVRTTKLTTGFTVVFNAPTDSADYVLEYIAMGHS